MKQYDYLIVGAGLYGAVFAQEAKKAGKKCLVIDKRSHIAGNIYTEPVEGINVHRYGAHIFHTNNKAVWQYVNQFAEFNRYTNSPVANYHGEIYNLPFNMNTFNKMWGVVTPAEAKAKIEEQKKEAGITDPQNLEEHEWVLNGSKCFITNGKEADVYIIIAVTGTIEKRGRKQKEISAFIVEKGTPGFTFGTKENKMGICGSSTYELIFTDCRIPKDALLGQKGKGFGIAMHTLDGGRIGIAAQALGIAEGALDITIDYVKERKQFGRSIAQFQNTQFVLADLATKVEAAKLLVYKAAKKKEQYQADHKTSYSVEAAMAKLYAAEVAMEVTTKCVQLHGGYGYIKEYDVERMMRDAKITEIYEGTSEVQRMVISANLLK